MEDIPRTTEESPGHAVKERWLAALAYLGPGFLLGIFSKSRTSFLNWHVRQGFTLFFLEMVGIALVLILDQTIGRIKLLGFLVMILARLITFVVFLVLSILGFVKAMAGENFRIPVLDDYAEKVPLSDD